MEEATGGGSLGILAGRSTTSRRHFLFIDVYIYIHNILNMSCLYMFDSDVNMYIYIGFLVCVYIDVNIMVYMYIDRRCIRLPWRVTVPPLGFKVPKLGECHVSSHCVFQLETSGRWLMYFFGGLPDKSFRCWYGDGTKRMQSTKDL